jgi:uncharacterized protein YegL
MTVIGLSGTQYQLDSNLLSDGGEGKIYRVLSGLSKAVAKIYKTGVPTHELEEKLKYMVHHQPGSNVLNQVAWPIDVIYDTRKKFSGFIMPVLSIGNELGEIYRYPSTLKISVYQKIIIAQNICVIVSDIHNAGYVIGDFNPRNIGLDMNKGIVSFLDTDTYHVVDPSQNKVYRCHVCAPGYSAPELLEKCANHISTNPGDKSQAYAKTPLPTFTKETDDFALAIHIFKLLMNGFSPFGGIIETLSLSQAAPGTGDAAVRQDNYCFKPGYKHCSTAVPTLNALPQEIIDSFTRAFISSKTDPTQRPSAVVWHSALRKYETGLKQCPRNELHQYYKDNISCPFCEADKRYVSIMQGSMQRIEAPNEPHLALVFLLDTSGAMKGKPIYQFYEALNRFKDKVCENKQTRDIIDVAIIEFNGTHKVVQEFAPIGYMERASFDANGAAIMVPAIKTALRMVRERSKYYCRCGFVSYTPWIILISGSAPSDDIAGVAREIKDMENDGKVSFRSFGVPGCDMATLRQLSGEKVLALNDADFASFFIWLAESMTSVSISSPDVQLYESGGPVDSESDWD